MYFHEYPKPAAVACYSLKGKQEMGRHEVNPFIYKNCLLYCTGTAICIKY